MKLTLKSPQSIWLLSLTVWLLFAVPCWQGARYRVFREWPETVGRQWVGFVPGKAAILTVWRSPRSSGDGEFDPWILNQIKVATGEVREIYRSDDDLESYLLPESGRWLVLIDLGENKGFRVTLLEIETGRKLIYDLPMGDVSPSMVSSPLGRFVAITDNQGAFWVFDLEGATPKFCRKPMDFDGIRTFCDWGFDINDQGHILALRGTESDPQSITTLCRYELESERWHTIHELDQDEMFVEISKDKNNKIFATVATKDSNKQIQIDAATGLPTEVQMIPTVDERLTSNSYLDWLEAKFPWLDISTWTQTIEYTSRSGHVYLLDSYPVSQGLPDFLPIIEPDGTHPYVGYSDDRGIHLWDDPPRRSIGSFLGMWFACGIAMAGLVPFAIWIIARGGNDGERGLSSAVLAHQIAPRSAGKIDS